MCGRRAEFALMGEDTLSVKKIRAPCNNKGGSTAGLSVEQALGKLKHCRILAAISSI